MGALGFEALKTLMLGYPTAPCVAAEYTHGPYWGCHMVTLGAMYYIPYSYIAPLGHEDLAENLTSTPST